MNATRPPRKRHTWLLLRSRRSVRFGALALLAPLLLAAGGFCSFPRVGPLSAAADEAGGPGASSPRGAEMRRAQQQYQRRCQRCHDADGSGAPVRTRSSPIPDFTSHPWHASRSDAELQVSILEGKGNRMPSFRGVVGEQDSRELVRFIRALDPEPGQAASSSSEDLDRRMRKLRAELEDLQKQFRELSDPRRRP